jgi:hypothetical protein
MVYTVFRCQVPALRLAEKMAGLIENEALKFHTNGTAGQKKASK